MNNLLKTKLKKNDSVIVISGKEKNKKGKILRIDRKKGRVYIEGVNMLSKTVKKKKQADRDGIIMVEGSVDISNVQLIDKDNKPARIKISVEDEIKSRISSRTGEKL